MVTEQARRLRERLDLVEKSIADLIPAERLVVAAVLLGQACYDAATAQSPEHKGQVTGKMMIGPAIGIAFDHIDECAATANAD